MRSPEVGPEEVPKVGHRRMSFGAGRTSERPKVSREKLWQEREAMLPDVSKLVSKGR